METVNIAEPSDDARSTRRTYDPVVKRTDKRLADATRRRKGKAQEQIERSRSQQSLSEEDHSALSLDTPRHEELDSTESSLTTPRPNPLQENMSTTLLRFVLNKFLYVKQEL